MKSVKIHEAKTNFSKLVASVETGEEVIIYRGKEPVAKLTGLEAPLKPREAGVFKNKGELVIHPGFEDIPEGFEEYT